MIAKCESCGHETVCGPDTEIARAIRETGMYSDYCWGCAKRRMVFREISFADASSDSQSWEAFYTPDAGMGLSEVGERIVAGEVAEN